MNKLILYDYNNLCNVIIFNKFMKNKYANFDNFTDKNFEIVKIDVLKSLLYRINKFIKNNKNDKFKIVFCKDSRHCWRKNLFKEYKIQRDLKNNYVGLNRSFTNKIFDQIWDEINDKLPFDFINVDTIESDDIIFYYVKTYKNNFDEIYIFSNDEDFQQLKNITNNIKIFNNIIGEELVVEDSKYELFKKIVKGDKSDNIPNIYSSTRLEQQSRIMDKRIKLWYNNTGEFNNHLKENNILDNYNRNKKLIDMTEIPIEILNKIETKVKSFVPKNNFMCIVNKYKLHDFYELAFVLNSILIK